MNNKTIEEIHQELQQSLIQGWKSFKVSDDFEILKDFFQFIIDAGFYDGKWENVLPNPAYDNAAKLIGMPFLEAARKLDVTFKEIFPGKFSQSTEIKVNKNESRQFKLEAFHKNQPLCSFSITFSHSHDKLDFPSPPQLKIEKIYK